MFLKNPVHKQKLNKAFSFLAAPFRKMKELMDRIEQDPRIRRLNRYGLLLHIGLSCLLILLIEACSRHSVIAALQFPATAPLTFLYNAFLVFTSLMPVFLFKRRFLIRLIITAFWLLLGITNGIILSARVTPFNFTDLKLIGDLFAMKNNKYLSVVQVVLIVIGLLLLLVVLLFVARSGPKYNGKIHRIRNLCGFLACLALLPVLTTSAIDSNILAEYFGNLAQGYKDYGFVYSFSASVVDTGMSKPDDYSEEAIASILDEVDVPETAIAQEDQPNIIFVQLESFIDPEEINFLNFSQDPCPNFRALTQNYTTGYLTVPVVGAGTSNTEFEVQTGMSLQYFGLGEYPYKTVLKTTPAESVAHDLDQIGYQSHAMHNNSGAFYSRSTVLRNLGFDSYTSKELMNITSWNELRTWATDDILTGETLKVLDSTPDQADFLYTITVQGHGAYPSTPVFTDPVIEVTGAATQEEAYQWEYYVNEMYEVDQFVGELIEELSERDEKTLVVFYGDHLPTMGLTDEDMKSGDIFKTVYATWDNFGLEKQNQDITTYQMVAYFMDRVGIHEGTIFKYHQSEMAAGTTEDASYLSDLELLQYDLIYGEKYAYGGEDLYPASDMEMGVADVVIKSFDTKEYSESVMLHGQNLTKWSYVYVDGEPVQTTYISGTTLLFPKEALSDGCKVCVCQAGGSRVFRRSNTVTFPDTEDLAHFVNDRSTCSGHYSVVNSEDETSDQTVEIKTAGPTEK